MCGRYVLVRDIQLIEQLYNLEPAEVEIASYQSYNVSPGQYAPVLTSADPQRLVLAQFGLTPSWAKKRMYLFNARSEGDHNKENDPLYRGALGIIKKPSFRKAIRSQRCIVWCNAFIEGPKIEKLSKPYIIYHTERSWMALAGLWEEWADPDTGELIRSFSIITTVASPLLQDIGHHRSPVQLDPEDISLWLDSASDLSEITALLRPYPDDAVLNAYPVSDSLRPPRAEGSHLLKPIGQRLRSEYDLQIDDHWELWGMGH